MICMFKFLWIHNSKEYINCLILSGFLDDKFLMSFFWYHYLYLIDKGNRLFS